MTKIVIVVVCSLALQSSGQTDLSSLESTEKYSDEIYDYYNTMAIPTQRPYYYDYNYAGGAQWLCGDFTSGVKCGPNCCNAGECCEGPNVCATGEVCERLKCQHEGGQVCDNACCKGDNPICCVTKNGVNQCVSDADSCQKSKCFDIGGNPCGEQCCTGNSTCCTSTTPDTCVSSLEDCIALECIKNKGQACDNSCCVGGTICCKGKCLETIGDCFAELCLEVNGLACGKQCCQEGSAKPHCCSAAFGCTKDVKECRKKEWDRYAAAHGFSYWDYDYYNDAN